METTEQLIKITSIVYAVVQLFIYFHIYGFLEYLKSRNKWSHFLTLKKFVFPQFLQFPLSTIPLSRLKLLAGRKKHGIGYVYFSKFGLFMPVSQGVGAGGQRADRHTENSICGGPFACAV